MKDSQETPQSVPKKQKKGKKTPARRPSSALAPASPLQRYIAEIASHPVLTGEEERELAARYRKTGDIEAARKLVASNLKFVVKVAGEYKNYGVGAMDIIQEGNLGLMQAVKRFDPTKGYRLISYAVWWIKAYIQKHIMDTWSLVRIGTGREQRKLFYKIRSTSGKMADAGSEATNAELADELGVSEKSIVEMKTAMSSRDLSLHLPVQDDSDVAHLDFLKDSSESPDEEVDRAQMKHIVQARMSEALSELGEKERHTIQNRLLSENPETLDKIGGKFGISRERVRQIEKTALKKIRKIFEKHGIENFED
ncbi:MAG: sigma-70 family RNA polymerase sigma factor [Candidatus Mycalebacterium zealandia]|nr:MAG: sigma-70 family RNA polymerase sigma factor [Candidatus Mycalebacterium zealandia]